MIIHLKIQLSCSIVNITCLSALSYVKLLSNHLHLIYHRIIFGPNNFLSSILSELGDLHFLPYNISHMSCFTHTHTCTRFCTCDLKLELIFFICLPNIPFLHTYNTAQYSYYIICLLNTKTDPNYATQRTTNHSPPQRSFTLSKPLPLPCPPLCHLHLVAQRRNLTTMAAPQPNGHTNGHGSSYAAKHNIASHFIGGNELYKAVPSKLKDFVAQHGGHTVIGNVRQDACRQASGH